MNQANSAQRMDEGKPVIKLDEDFSTINSLNSEQIFVTCGDVPAKLHIQRFLCPGIHEKCIEIEGESEFITPKEYTVRANKDKQKDWKGSIRIGRSNLRTLMEQRMLDFHNHHQSCNGRCQSRNYLNPVDKTRRPSSSVCDPKTDNSITNPMTILAALENNSAPAEAATSTPPPEEPNIDFNEILKQVFNCSSLDMSPNSQETKNSESNNDDDDNSAITKALNATLNSSFNDSTEDISDNIDITNITNFSNFKPYTFGNIGTADYEKILKDVLQRPARFWKQMARDGLAGDIIDKMINRLVEIKTCINNGQFNKISGILSRTAVALENAHETLPIPLLVQRKRAAMGRVCNRDPKQMKLDAEFTTFATQSLKVIAEMARNNDTK